MGKREKRKWKKIDTTDVSAIAAKRFEAYIFKSIFRFLMLQNYFLHDFFLHAIRFLRI
jgi:hypothetical protein